jgi:cardiolipin synthase
MNPWRPWTIPNAVSLIRLLGIPLFLYLLLAQDDYFWSLCVLIIAGATDWVDGYLARKLNQVSRLGVLLDPLVDRLYIAATLVGLALASLIPWWLVVVIALRDIALLALIPSLGKMGISALPVTYIGKAATFALLWGFPLILLGGLDSTIATVMAAAGWAFALWGTSLYWWSGVRYFVQARTLLEDFNRKG